MALPYSVSGGRKKVFSIFERRRATADLRRYLIQYWEGEEKNLLSVSETY